MAMIGAWSMFAVLCQTFISIVISWATLECRLEPQPSELHEVTLVKLLYLYDPQACGRTQFYNYTVNVGNGQSSAIVWPVKNDVAEGFRKCVVGA